MIRPTLACLRCGHEGADVLMRWPDLEREAREEGRAVALVEVEVATFIGRHVTQTEIRRVPERYGRLEPRCADSSLCLTRWRAQAEPCQPGPGVPATRADDEVVPWI